MTIQLAVKNNCPFLIPFLKFVKQCIRQTVVHSHPFEHLTVNLSVLFTKEHTHNAFVKDFKT